MNRIALLAFPLTLCLACSREEAAPDAEPAPTATAEPAAAPPPAAPATAPAAAPAAAPSDPAADFDTGAFSGTFAGGGVRLELRGDGSYALEGPQGATLGAWTHEATSNSIRLDPGNKTEQDRVYRMTDRDTLTDASGAALTRQPAP